MGRPLEYKPDNQIEDKKSKFSMGMILVAIGIVYGDIGTSPMYVMKSIVEGNGGIQHVDPEFIVGSLSLVIWTITLLTTVKHVLIALKADNHGEGGIFALYTLVRDYGNDWRMYDACRRSVNACCYSYDSCRRPPKHSFHEQIARRRPVRGYSYYTYDCKCAVHDPAKRYELDR